MGVAGDGRQKVPMSQENAALVRQFLTDAVVGGDIDTVDGCPADELALSYDTDTAQESSTRIDHRPTQQVQGRTGGDC